MMCKQVFGQYKDCKHRANVRFEICLIAASERSGKPSPFPCSIDPFYEPQNYWPPKCPECREQDRIAEEHRKRQEVLDEINLASKRPGTWLPGLGYGKKTDKEEAVKQKEKISGKEKRGRSMSRNRASSRGEWPRPSSSMSSFPYDPDERGFT
jgi:hypothetical protein